MLDRPLAAGRPFNSGAPTGLWGRRSDALKSAPTSPTKGNDMSRYIIQEEVDTKSPPNQASSPTKSSLSRNSRYGNNFEDNSAMSEEEDIIGRQLPSGRSLRRHAKSVTFDTGPPEINEYEMTTPDPSSVASESRQGSYESNEEDDEDISFNGRPKEDNDDSFDASLEDTEKTPVVLPEDWRFMSPDNANDILASKFEDPFTSRMSPCLGAEPIINDARPSPSRTDSIGSNGERRPLPPLPPPPFLKGNNQRASSPGTLQAVAERVASTSRTLPNTPKAAAVSKSELQNLSSASMSLDDRLRLMMLQQDDHKVATTKAAVDEQRERRLRRAGASPDRTVNGKSEFKIHEDEDGDVGQTLDIQMPSMISRESILRKVKDHARTEIFSGSPTPSINTSPGGRSNFSFDPDVPMPSLEDRLEINAGEDAVFIKKEDHENEIDLYSIPETYSSVPQFERLITDEYTTQEDDDESHYSEDFQDCTADKEGPSTPKASAQTHGRLFDERRGSAMALPQLSSMLGVNDFSSSFSLYTATTNHNNQTAYEPTMDISYSRGLDLKSRTEVHVATVPIVQPEPEAKIESDRESTPESIIRHPIYTSDDEENDFQPPPIPESKASIKAPGGLKTRASLAPADVNAMAEVRRKVSGERPTIPPVPTRHRNRPSVILEQDSFVADIGHASPTKLAKRKSSLLPLEVPVDLDTSLSVGIDREFDRVMEASKKGYLMRQNTKLVVASSEPQEAIHQTNLDMPPPSRGSRSAGNSPVKGSATWTTEPWNGKIRRKSIRQSGGGPMMRLGVAPPLPGMNSNVSYEPEEPIDGIIEEGNDFEDDKERGRLFVKVVGVKDLDMPLPRGKCLKLRFFPLVC